MSSCGVKAIYSVDGKVAHEFEATNTDGAHQRARLSTSPIDRETEADTKYDHKYTGRHDHGSLPQLKSGGIHDKLIKALLESKADSDQYLTSVIEQEQVARRSRNETLEIDKAQAKQDKEDNSNSENSAVVMDEARTYPQSTKNLPDDLAHKQAKRPRP